MTTTTVNDAATIPAHRESLTPTQARALWPDDMSLRDARAIHFARSGFDETSYVDRWVRLRFGPIPVCMPNVAARKDAVRVHDLDHVLTGYGTDWPGEFEISAFEIGMGTGRYWFGWFLDVGGLAGGLLLWPTRTLRAYARGRRTKASLYRLFDTFTDAALTETVGSLRARVGIGDGVTPTARDVVGALAWAALGLTIHVGAPLAALAAVASVIAGS